MYRTSLYYKISTTKDKESILRMFFEDWAEGICNQEIKYTTVLASPNLRNISYSWWDEIIRVDFNNEEDATAMKLKGIPEDLQSYIKNLTI
jgi:hypothetical protein